MPRRSGRALTAAWADLYRKASAVKELAPWSRLTEDQLFAMEVPGLLDVGPGYTCPLRRAVRRGELLRSGR
jgi:hypothetical protein